MPDIMPVGVQNKLRNRKPGLRERKQIIYYDLKPKNATRQGGFFSFKIFCAADCLARRAFKRIKIFQLRGVSVFPVREGCGMPYLPTDKAFGFTLFLWAEGLLKYDTSV